jgi:hypothetical protein
MTDNIVTENPKVPTSQDLHEIFKEFLLKWTGVAVQQIEISKDEIPNLPLELGLMFFEPRVGILVIRASDTFESLLEKSASGGKTRETKLGFFTEIVVLFWNRLVSKFWGMESRKLKQAMFKKSIPLDWPNRNPDAAIAVFAEKELVEIRFWSPISEGEMENWKKSRK